MVSPSIGDVLVQSPLELGDEMAEQLTSCLKKLVVIFKG